MSRLSKLIYCVLFSLCFHSVSAQTISIDNALFQPGPYGQGSTISVPLKMAGCFKWNNVVRLFLCSPSNPAGVQVGIINQNGSFSTFINARIPNGTAARADYYFEARTTLPVITSNQSSPLEIKNIAAPVAFINTTSANRRLIDSLNYGYCSVGTTPTRSLTLLNQSTSGSTTTITYRNESNNAVSNLSMAPGGSEDVTLNTTFYTLFCRAEKDGVVSTRSFFLLNTTHNLSLQTSGELRACLPDPLQVSVNVSNALNSIVTNFPGTYYIFDWGDTKPNDTLTNCEIVGANGIISHIYLNSSCGTDAVVGGTKYSNAYPVDIKYINPFKNASNTNNCDEPSIATFSRIFRKPLADFTSPVYACLSSRVTFTNATVAGIAQAGDLCTDAQSYEWYVDGTFVANTLNLGYTFNTLGNHLVRLKVENASCGPSEITKSICIEASPVAAFLVNGLDSVAECAQPILVVRTTNNSNNTGCRSNIWKWEVYNDSTKALVRPGPTTYTITPNDTAFQPVFNFTAPGRYAIRLTASNSCGTSAPVNKIVKVLGTAGVSLPKDTGYCSANISINFAINALHKPTYNSEIGNEEYEWTITGGSFAFQASSSAASKYPVILFSDYGTYNVKVRFKNNCGIQVDSQYITFSQPNSVNIQPDSLAICYNQDTLQLTGAVAGAVDSVKWSTSGSGTFSPASSATTVYTIGAVDRTRGGVSLFLRAYTRRPSGCPDATDSIRVRIAPRNFGRDTLRTICDSALFIFSPVSSVAGSLFSWESVVVSGTVAGNTASGTGTISDRLDNTGNNTDAAVRYTIKPAANNCPGEAYALTVTVKPKPQLSVDPKSATICSGQRTNIVLGSSVAGSTYSWTSQVVTGAVSGNTNRSNQALSTIADLLTNNGSTDAAILYKIVALSSAACPGDTQTVSITVASGVTRADAGADDTICGLTQAALRGNTPATGTGVWLQVSGPASVITDSASASTQVTGLLPGASYKYVWKITAASTLCGSSSDTVMITVQPEIINRIDTALLSICAGVPVTLGASPATGGAGSYQYQWQRSADGTNFTNLPGDTLAVLANQLLAATTYYRRLIKSGPCTKISDTKKVVVQPGISNNSISASQTVCINVAAAVLTGRQPAGGNSVYAYQWESSTDGIGWTAIAGATGLDYNPGLLRQTTQYRRRVSTDLCSGLQASASNPVTITVNPDAKAAFNAAKTRVCVNKKLDSSIIRLVPYNDLVSEYRWYINNRYLGSGQFFPGYTFQNPGDSITVKLLAISRFGCRNDSTEQGFTAVKVPLPSFTQSDSTGCGPVRVAFNNTTPDAGQYTYLWDFGNGLTSASVQPGGVVFEPHPLNRDTTYTILFKTITDCDTIVRQRYVTVFSKPKALFTPDLTVGCSPMKVTFTNTSRGNGNSYVWDFGNGSPLLSSGDQKVTDTFYTGIRATVYVKLLAANRCGKDSLTYAIVVNPNTIQLDFALNGNERFGCAPHTVNLINNSSGANVYNWTFGDGGTLTTLKGVDTVPYQFKTPGTYTVTLHATNTCSDTSDTEIVTVQPVPKVKFTVLAPTACIGDTLRLMNESEPGVNYSWNFGDGSTIDGARPGKSYASPGQYTIILTGARIYSPGNGCSSIAIGLVTIVDTLPGSFSSTASPNVCAPYTVSFKGLAGDAAQTTWDFGDRSTGRGDSISHTFSTPGTYTVKMIAKSTGGCTYVSSRTFTVGGASGSLSYQGGSLCPGDSLRLEALSGNSARYRFVFGDGDSLTTTAPVVKHLYAKPGVYLPYAYLLSGACETKAVTGDSVRVDRLKAGFKTAVQYNCGATTVAFTDTSGAFFGIRSWQWNFGDGTGATERNPVKLFAQPGLYPVRLRITGASGCTDTVSLLLSVTVHDKPVSVIDGRATACTNQPVALKSLAQSIEPITNAWDFGNGSTASGTSVAATYSSPGTYRVRLISRTQFGCADTAYQTVQVNQSPVVDAGRNQTICIGQQVQLNASGASDWQWAPLQNLSCYTCANPVARPAITTAYAATGSNGFCSTTDTVLVEVIQRLRLSVSPNDSICIRDSTQLFAGGAFTYAWSPAFSIPGRSDVPNPVVKPATTTVYQVVGTDQYHCFSDTAYTTVAVGQYPTVKLGAGATVVAGTPVNLQAVVTNGPVKRYTWTPSSLLSCTNCGNPVATINKDILYRLDVENSWGCSASDTIRFKIYCDDSQLFVPNAFSPDGDGTNDVFTVRGKGIAKINYFRVFNRWGQKVFERSYIGANDPAQGWDGRVNGKIVQDVYVYSIEAVCTGGQLLKKEGNVSLMIMR